MSPFRWTSTASRGKTLDPKKIGHHRFRQGSEFGAIPVGAKCGLNASKSVKFACRWCISSRPVSGGRRCGESCWCALNPTASRAGEKSHAARRRFTTTRRPKPPGTSCVIFWFPGRSSVSGNPLRHWPSASGRSAATTWPRRRSKTLAGTSRPGARACLCLG